MKELIGMEIEWNETVEISLSFTKVTNVRREKNYYFVDAYRYKENKYGVKYYEYELIELDGSGRKRKVNSKIFEDEYKEGNIKLATYIPPKELTL